MIFKGGSHRFVQEAQDTPGVNSYDISKHRNIPGGRFNHSKIASCLDPTNNHPGIYRALSPSLSLFVPCIYTIHTNLAY